MLGMKSNVYLMFRIRSLLTLKEKGQGSICYAGLIGPSNEELW